MWETKISHVHECDWAFNNLYHCMTLPGLAARDLKSYRKKCEKNVWLFFPAIFGVGLYDFTWRSLPVYVMCSVKSYMYMYKKPHKRESFSIRVWFSGMSGMSCLNCMALPTHGIAHRMRYDIHTSQDDPAAGIQVSTPKSIPWENTTSSWKNHSLS